MSAQELSLHELALPNNIWFGPLGIASTEFKHPAIRKVCNISSSASVKPSLQDYHSWVQLGGIALDMGGRDSRGILFTLGHHNILLNHCHWTSTKLGNHTKQCIVMVDVECLHVRPHQKATNHHLSSLNDINSQLTVLGVSLVMDSRTEEGVRMEVVSHIEAQEGSEATTKPDLMKG